ncbi:hypothetical protein CW704_01440 [Candidatus Bathyarchaeota archaeon]|mgnify:FL=1|nr:MAG: hypothetical protein CW704_01440 [Candidatus Bathyarchaeota archaeon]RLI06509.1 MAG: hypothetical protein DRO22_00760 [Candidatus Bathyarchaeota archaeon]
MPVDEIIDRILSSRRELTRRMILQLIDSKIKESKGFLTVESAARAVAAELGLEITRVSLMKGTSIRNLVSGLGNVTIVGRILHVNPPRTFTRSNGEEGKMRSLYIADKTGVLRVVIWGEKAELLGSSETIGKIVRFSHGYVRKGYGGRLELNIGLKGNIEISPPDIFEEEFPSINRFYKKIKQITKPETRVNTFGRVVKISPINTFTREGGVSGKVRRIEIRDQTGRITVVLWNNKVDELGDLEIGKYLEIFGAKVRKDLNGRLELHVDGSVDVTVLSNLPSGFKEDYLKA